MSNETLTQEVLTAFRDHDNLTSKECFDLCHIATERRQVSSLISKLLRSRAYLAEAGYVAADDPRNDTGQQVRAYSITDKGKAHLDYLTAINKKPDADIIEKAGRQLIEQVAQAEPIQPWEFEPAHDPIVRSINALHIGSDSLLYREGRERAGRLRYLAERLERVSGRNATEAGNVAADLRGTADLLDELMPTDVSTRKSH